MKKLNFFCVFKQREEEGDEEEEKIILCVLSSIET